MSTRYIVPPATGDSVGIFHLSTWEPITPENGDTFRHIPPHIVSMKESADGSYVEEIIHILDHDNLPTVIYDRPPDSDVIDVGGRAPSQTALVGTGFSPEKPIRLRKHEACIWPAASGMPKLQVPQSVLSHIEFRPSHVIQERPNPPSQHQRRTRQSTSQAGFLSREWPTRDGDKVICNSQLSLGAETAAVMDGHPVLVRQPLAPGDSGYNPSTVYLEPGTMASYQNGIFLKGDIDLNSWIGKTRTQPKPTTVSPSNTRG